MRKIALVTTLLASVAGGTFVVEYSPQAMACNTPNCDATVPGQPASQIADPALTDYPVTLPGEPC